MSAPAYLLEMENKWLKDIVRRTGVANESLNKRLGSTLFKEEKGMEEKEKELERIRYEMENIAYRQVRPDLPQDYERDHGEADDMLCDALLLLGETELVENFKRLTKWYA